MLKMIDFHNHILPNVDDGSKSMEMSLNMLKEAESQGITEVVNTIHYQHPKMDDKDTSYKFIIDKVEELQSEVDKLGIKIKIHCGSEVFFQHNLVSILDYPLSTIGDGKHMLVEFQTLSFPDKFQDELYELMINGVTPIIAHPERYRVIQNDISIIRKWIDLGYIIQIDCGSVLGFFNKRTKEVCDEIVSKGLFHLMGSDAHNDSKRNFCFKPALEYITKKHGKLFSEIILSNSKKIINGEECVLPTPKIKRRYNWITFLINKFKK